jgi:3-hydroxybutyryl-CoA dehydratase
LSLSFVFPSNVTFENVFLNQLVEEEYEITAEIYEHYIAAFRDVSPLHMDDAFAQNIGFPGKVMHGGILNGFISHFVGVVFPGTRAIIHYVHVDYHAPSFIGDHILLSAKVSHKIESLRAMVLSLSLKNTSQGTLAAKAKVQVGFTS